MVNANLVAFMSTNIFQRKAEKAIAVMSMITKGTLGCFLILLAFFYKKFIYLLTRNIGLILKTESKMAKIVATKHIEI